jgi:MFS family permease
MQGAFILWLANTQDAAIFFLYAIMWGFGYGGVGTQYGVVARELYGTRLFGPGYYGQNCFAMLGMAVVGFLGGYLFDVSHSYVSAWLLSFGAGFISSLLALDLLTQGERAKPRWPQPQQDRNAWCLQCGIEKAELHAAIRPKYSYGLVLTGA